MPGLRIYHPELRNGVLKVPIPAKTAEGSPKDVTIVIDADGYAIVSQGVWDELLFAIQHGNMHTFLIMNEVPDPPAMEVGDIAPDFGRETYVQVQDALQQIAPAGVNFRVVENGLPPSV